MIRRLTLGEQALAKAMFGPALDLEPVTVRRRKWFPFQPKDVIMAPTGHVHVHPQSQLWSEDYSGERLHLQALFLHELTHVWQTQERGKLYLPLMRHPFCRYRYTFEEGRPFDRYGIEQQAELVRHAFMARAGRPVAGAPTLEQLEQVLPFRSG
jgi:hypothetical protein